METSRFVSIVLTSFMLCLTMRDSVAVGDRRIVQQLNALRQDLLYVHNDISELFETVKTLNKTSRMGQADSKDGDEIEDDVPREDEREGRIASKGRDQIVDKLLSKYELLLRAFESEKRINRQLQQQLDSFEESITDRIEEAIGIILSKSSVNQEVITKIQNVRKDVHTVDKNVEKIVEDVQNVVDDIQNMKENIESLSEEVHIVNVTQTKLSETVDNVSKLNNNSYESLEENVADSFKDMAITMTSMKYSVIAIQEECEKNIQTIRDDVNRVDKNVTKVADEKVSKDTIQTCKTVPKSGVYDIFFDSMRKHVSVYCDQDTDGGGWIVFMRRQDGSENFARSWQDFKSGFGNRHGEFWAGNDLLHKLTESKPLELGLNTKSKQFQLRIDMEDFIGNKAFAQYEHFKIGPESDKYRLSVSDYSGTAGDSLINAKQTSHTHIGQQFSTFDSDNDQDKYGECAAWFKGGWWFNHCLYSHLTGIYSRTASITRYHGIIWGSWKGFGRGMKFVEMKIRRV